MILAIAAALSHGAAYCMYLTQVFAGSSVPNPASWSIWAYLSALNAVTFWRGSKDALATAQFFTGSVGCITVWMYSIWAGRFAPINTLGWIVLVLCLTACLVWWLTRSAVYANLMVGGILTISFIPTFAGVFHAATIERALPWYLWTLAFAITTTNVVRRRRQARWWLMLVTPILGMICHGVVAVVARG
ncbi:MAG TPA: hypothetical protein VJ553_05105 [Candidatus Paceibacterota bacterium]|nr:hypothetical protein [Candidatus Paceibacterota bacterium]